MGIQERTTEVRETIEKAFSASSYPGDANIAGIESLEGRELAKGFKGRHWKDLPEIEWHSGALGLLTDQAYRFFLPGFLIASLKLNAHNEHLSVHGERYVEEIVSHLKFTGFSKTELNALKLYLEFLKNDLWHGQANPEVESGIERCSELAGGS